MDGEYLTKRQFNALSYEGQQLYIAERLEAESEVIKCVISSANVYKDVDFFRSNNPIMKNSLILRLCPIRRIKRKTLLWAMLQTLKMKI